MELRYHILLLLGSVFLTAVFCFWYSGRKFRKRVDYMLDAVEDGEVNFRFREDRRTDRRINRTLNRMKRIYEKERDEIREKESFYGQMLDKVRTGIVVVDDAEGHVAYCNSAALSLLGLSTLLTVKQLERIDLSLAEAFSRVAEGHEQQVSFLNEIVRRTVLMKASQAWISGRYLKIIVFDDVSMEMDEKESVSWTKLVRVLTHEIRNTVTPIASLSDALLEEGRKTGTEAGDSSRINLSASLETISASAKGLLRFVESYRAMAHVSVPVRKVVYLRELAERVMNLVGPQLHVRGAECVYEEQSDDIILYIDMDQISQVFVNLLKNALEAGAERIRITARIDAAESVVVEVANNGLPISEKGQEEIFVPFYTTKSSGTGLGLSLSRQIMRLHNGSLLLSRSDNTETVFLLIFR